MLLVPASYKKYTLQKYSKNRIQSTYPPALCPRLYIALAELLVSWTCGSTAYAFIQARRRPSPKSTSGTTRL